MAEPRRARPNPDPRSIRDLSRPRHAAGTPEPSRIASLPDWAVAGLAPAQADQVRSGPVSARPSPGPRPSPGMPPSPGVRPTPGPRPSPGMPPSAAARPMPGPRPPAAPRPMPAPRPVRPGLEARAPRSRPDPNPLRLLLAFAGIASASAITTAMLPSILPAGSSPVDAAVFGATGQGPQASVLHVTRYVTLQPGQTAPPNAPVVVQPTPTPRVHVVTRTRQSGVP